MSWARYLATGSGKTEFRLAIEGLPYEFVTYSGMERALSGSTTGRLRGLKRESLIGGEEVHPGTAELEQDVVNVRIVETLAEEIAAVLAYRPSITTWLTSELSASATSVEVESTAGIAAGDRVYIGTECLGVSVVVDADTLTVARALHSSIAQRHVIGDGETRANPPVTNRPLFLEGRRATLYAYGEGDSPTGDGTQIWLGVCQTDARLEPNGCEWTIQIAGIWQITEQDLGADLTTPRRPRGVYYPYNNAFKLYIGESASATKGTLEEAEETVYITGHYETQEEFCTALTAAIAATGVFTGTLVAVSDGPSSHWYFKYTAHAATFRWPYIRSSSALDLNFDAAGPTEDSQYPRGIPTVTAGSEHKLYPLGYGEDIAAADFGTVPRGSFGGPPGTNVSSAIVTAPHTRIYLDAAPSTEVPATLLATSYGVNGEKIDGAIHYSVADVTDNFIEDPTIASAPLTTWTASRLPEFRLVRTYFYHGSVDDFRAAIVADAAENGNTGTWPFVTSSDLATWTNEVAHYARDRALATQRVYAGSEATSLREMLTQEFRLIGVFPIVTTTGTIDIQGLRLAAPTEPTEGSLVASNVLVDSQRPTWERNALGTINTVRLLTGWNPRTNEHQDRVITVRDVGSYSLRKATRELEIAPRSALVDGDDKASTADFVALTKSVLGIFGRDYVIVDLEAAMTCFGYVLGDLVSLTFDSLPNWTTGTRGINGAAAIVIGRRWDLNRGRVRLRLMLSGQQVAGYTPTLTITGKNSGTDGTTGPFNFSWSTLDPLGNASYLADNDLPTNHWAAGAVAVLSEWDATSPTQKTGTISSFSQSTATTGTLIVTFTSSFTWSGASKWVLRYPSANTTGLVQAQSEYCYLADGAAFINFAAGLTDRSADTFAPG